MGVNAIDVDAHVMVFVGVGPDTGLAHDFNDLARPKVCVTFLGGGITNDTDGFMSRHFQKVSAGDNGDGSVYGAEDACSTTILLLDKVPGAFVEAKGDVEFKGIVGAKKEVFRGVRNESVLSREEFEVSCDKCNRFAGPVTGS